MLALRIVDIQVDPYRLIPLELCLDLTLRIICDYAITKEIFLFSKWWLLLVALLWQLVVLAKFNTDLG